MAEVRSKTKAMQAEALTVTPLRAMATDPERVKKLCTRNARRSQASPSGKTSEPTSSVPPEISNREGSRYVHEVIARIVTRILNENHSVPGVSVPLNQKSASPSLAADPDVTENVKTSDDHAKKTHVDPDTETPVDSPVKDNVNPSEIVPEVCVDDACNEPSVADEDEISDG